MASKKDTPADNVSFDVGTPSPQQYVAPSLMQTVEAADYDEAVSKLNPAQQAEQKDQEVGDGNL